MSRPDVQAILKQIDELSESDKLLLEEALAERSEAVWLEESAKARQAASERGLTAEDIDRAVEEVRYGTLRSQ